MTEFSNLISVSQLENHSADQDWCLVDCRFDLMQPQKGRQDYVAGHIPGAVFADLDLDLADPISPESGRHPLPDVEKFTQCVARSSLVRPSRVPSTISPSSA